MRVALAVLACGGLLLAGCGGGSSAPSGSSTTPPILPPTASVGGPYTGNVGTAVTFNGSGSKDPQNQSLTYSWNFGDGCGTQANGYVCATGTNPTHSYTQATQIPGQTTTAYPVTLTVQDTSGYSGQASTTATITGASPLADATLTGSVSTGSTGIVGAHVYLLAANTSGYGGPSNSLLSSTQTGTSETAGATAGDAYVVTDSAGNFALTGDYTCTSSQQLYIYALGGTAGSTSITSAGLLAAIGACPTTGTTVTVKVDEVSTIAAAYALAAFATDATHVSAPSNALAQADMANAFLSAGNLVKLSTGAALTTTPGGNGTVPQTEINALANILSVCVNPTNYVAGNCTSLLGDALPGGTTGTPPTETATAAIYIAHNPGSALISDIYNLTPSTPPYTPTLGRQPNDFTVAISYSGGGLSGPQQIAVDGAGNVWVTNPGGNTVTKLTTAGAVATGSPFSSGGLSTPYGIAIDGNGNAWIANKGSGSVTELSSSGSVVSTGSGYAGCSISGPKGIAVDASNDAWIADAGHNLLCELSSTGSVLSSGGFSGGGLNNPDAVAIDNSGNVWVANASGASVSKFTGGVAQSGANGYSGGGLSSPQAIAMDANGSAWVADLTPTNLTVVNKTGVAAGVSNTSLSSPVGVAVDGLGDIWVANQTGNTVTEYTNAGIVISGSTGFGGAVGSASGIAIDGSGNVWVGNSTQNTVTEYVGAAAPVVTPLSVVAKVGTRP